MSNHMASPPNSVDVTQNSLDSIESHIVGFVDYNDLVVEPEIERMFSENPDRIFEAFSRAIKEALQMRLIYHKVGSLH